MPESRDQSEKLPDTFEDAMAELESIVRELEASRMPLGDLVDNYERGTRLLDYCRGEIQVARQRVEKIAPAVGGDAGDAGDVGGDESGEDSGKARSSAVKSRARRGSGNASGNEDDEDGRLL